MAGILFHFTGVSITAARALVIALFAITLAATYFFARRHASVPVAMAILSIAVTSPFLFAFSRLAIVEPVLLCLFATALLTADHSAPRRPLVLCALAALLITMMLTKPTALVLFPAIALVLWHRLPASAFFKHAATLFLITTAAYAAYYAVIVHFHYQADYHYLFAANNFGHPAKLKLWLIDLRFCLQALLAVDPALVLAAAAVVLASCFRPLRTLWTNPLYTASLLTIAGNVSFVLLRNYQAPHYYLFSPLALAAIVILGSAAIFTASTAFPRRAILAAIALLILTNAATTARMATHPRYTLISAANSLTRYIHDHPSGRRMLLSESGDQISLITGLPSIGDDFGTIPLTRQLADQHPGWFANWNYTAAPVLAEIHTQHHLQRVADYPVMDDPSRNLLILYRMVPLTEPDEGVDIRPEERQMQHRPAQASAHATTNLH